MKIPVKTAKDNNVTEQNLNEQAEMNGETAAQESQTQNPQDPPFEGEESLPSATAAELASDAIPEGVAEPLAGEATETAQAEPVCAEEVPEEDELSRLKKQLQAKEQEAKEQYEARLRLQAEVENFKKRKEKEIADFRKYAHESFVVALLPVVEDFERAIAAAEQTHKLEDFLKGIELIFGKFFDVLQKKGVKEIEASKGQVFNPAIHEAVMQIETNDVEEGMIAQVFQKGYYLHERVLQASKVGVAKKAAA